LSGRFPRLREVDEFGFEEADFALCQRIVVAVTDATNRRIDPGIGQAFSVFDR
jgi:hypothetical protein